MRVYFYILFILPSCVSGLIGQEYCDYKYDHVWIMGGVDIDTTEDRYGGFEINFNSNPPSLTKHPKYFEVLIQSTSMSSIDGDLIFYSNGCLVLNALDKQMENGDSLNPGYVYEDNCPDHGYIGFQNMFALPDSYKDSIYYLFHIDLTDNLDTILASSLISEHLYCTTIDMSGDNGLGKVQSKNSVVLRDTTMMGGPMTAIKHANGLDWWIITPNRWTNSYNLILVNELGPKFVGRQYIGSKPDSNAVGGQGKFSPDGSKFAWYHPDNGLFLFDFDRQAGVLSNFLAIDIPQYSGVSGGLEFSPLSNFLYVNHDTSLFQLDLRSSDIQGSLTHIADYDYFVDVTPTPFFYMERTPDQRIFMNPLFGSQWLHVIQEPDKRGIACRFEQHILKLPTVNNFTLPHFPNYRLGPLGTPLCDSIWVSEVYPARPAEIKYQVSPNPASGHLRINHMNDRYEEGFEITLYGSQGDILLHSTEWEVDITRLPSGIYFCRLSDDTGYTQVVKIVAIE